MRTVRGVIAVVATLLLGACGWFSYLRGYSEAPSSELADALARTERATIERGATLFVYDDLGGLSTDALESNAVPWRLLMASLALVRADSMRQPLTSRLLDGILSPYGFIVPDSLLNWPGPSPAPTFTQPIGLLTGRLSRRIPNIELQIGNLGCASCHTGVLYTSDGTPTPGRAWLGLPNTSLDVQAFVTAAYRALKYAVANEARVLAAVDTLFPDVSARERSSLRGFVLPRARRRITELAATIDAPVPFSNGSAGLTNGAAAMKYQLGLLAPDRPAAEHGYTSIPDLGSRELRSSLLYDGTYAATGATRFATVTRADVTEQHVGDLARVVALFTVPVMGVHPSRAVKAQPHVKEIMRFFLAYDPPRFPGAIDSTAAIAGRMVYLQRCARCHGDVGEGIGRARLVSFPNALVAQAEIGTDSARWTTITPTTVQALRASSYGSYVHAARTGGYVAPPLTALWATAPYLHNGSVPTLWHLMHPAERPARFQVGGHRLDFTRVGIALENGADGIARYPASYVPWSRPHVYDTREPGRGSRGHEQPFVSLSEREKSTLLEFLKLF